MKSIFLPKNGFYIFSIFIFIFYAAVPALIWGWSDSGEYFAKLSFLALFSIFFLFFGFFLPIFDWKIRHGPYLIINVNLFTFLFFSFVLLFFSYTIYTAPSIPLISGILGKDADQLSVERGGFFKARSNWEVILGYIFSFLSSTLIPLALILMHLYKKRLRYILTILIFFFYISFLQKSLFLNILLPVLVALELTGKLSNRIIICGAGLAIALLILFVSLSLGEMGSVIGENAIFFSAAYRPANPFDYFLWRIFAVPIFTATDTLLVHSEIFKNDFFYGNTSLIISSFLSEERVNLERLVFNYQFGGWNEIANANAVFIADAYANFGLLGVALFSLAVGQIFRMFTISKDTAVKCLWPIFAFSLFSASLLGTLFSNGFLYIAFHILFVKISKKARLKHGKEK